MTKYAERSEVKKKFSIENCVLKLKLGEKS